MQSTSELDLAVSDTVLLRFWNPATSALQPLWGADTSGGVFFRSGGPQPMSGDDPWCFNRHEGFSEDVRKGVVLKSVGFLLKGAGTQWQKIDTVITATRHSILVVLLGNMQQEIRITINFYGQPPRARNQAAQFVGPCPSRNSRSWVKHHETSWSILETPKHHRNCCLFANFGHMQWLVARHQSAPLDVCTLLAQPCTTLGPVARCFWARL